MVNAQLVVTALKVRKALLTIWALLILKTLLIVNVPPLVKALLTEKRKNKGSDLSSEVSCHSDKQGIVGIRCKRFGKYLTIPNNKYIVL